MQVVHVSSKSIRNSRKAIIAAALKRQGEKIGEVTPEEGATTIVRGTVPPKVVTWYRQIVESVGGSVPQLAGEVFSDDETAKLNQIESDLWARGDQKAPPKTGVEIATRIALRSVIQGLIPAANPEVFPPQKEDSTACFLETVHYGLPKLHTPKGAVATADVDSLIRQLLGL